MKQFRVRTWEEFIFADDVTRIGKVLEKNGYASTPEQCYQLWKIYSESLCASWLILPTRDETVFNLITVYMQDV